MEDPSHQLSVGRAPPAERFGSSTVDGFESRSVTRNESGRSERASRAEGLPTKEDGSVAVFFGPGAPEGAESNRIETNEGQSLLVYLGLYGPEQACIDQPWLMTPITELNCGNPMANPVCSGIAALGAVCLVSQASAETTIFEMTTGIPAAITTPNTVETSIGTPAFSTGC